MYEPSISLTQSTLEKLCALNGDLEQIDSRLMTGRYWLPPRSRKLADVNLEYSRLLASMTSSMKKADERFHRANELKVKADRRGAKIITALTIRKCRENDSKSRAKRAASRIKEKADITYCECEGLIDLWTSSCRACHNPKNPKRKREPSCTCTELSGICRNCAMLKRESNWSRHLAKARRQVASRNQTVSLDLNDDRKLKVNSRRRVMKLSTFTKYLAGVVSVFTAGVVPMGITYLGRLVPLDDYLILSTSVMWTTTLLTFGVMLIESARKTTDT